MPRTLERVLPVVAAVAVALVAIPGVAPRILGQAARTGNAAPSAKNGEWPTYSADLRGSRYSPLDQIDASNFNKLEVAWRFKTDNLGPRIETKIEGTPLMVGGMLYATGGTRRAVVALDARSGEMKWMHSMDEGLRAAASPRQLSGRGVAYWTDGRGDDRIVYVTIGYQLVELNAKTGQVISTFGKNGVVDLKVGVVYGKDKQIPLDRGEIGLHATPIVVNDTIIVGSAHLDGQGYKYSMNAKGLVRAFDAKTGKQLWRFNTIPSPGEFGNDTWGEGSWEWTGNVGVWNQIVVDPEAGLAYLPVESPTIDYYGGNRPGNNLFSDCLVALDLKTGQRKWFFQLVHHDIWDMDIPASPLLIDATIDGRPRKLIAQPTKQGRLYVFDRITGQPIWPMPETPVPQTDVPGEKTAPTQPFPSKPEPYSRAFLSMDDVIDFTPELRKQALENLKKYRWEQTPFVPASAQGSINVGNAGGGINWAGAGFDPETATFYGQANNSGVSVASITEAYLKIVAPDVQSKGRIPFWEGEPPPGATPPPAPPPAAAPAGQGGRGAPPAGGAGIPGPGGGGREGLVQGLGGLPIAKPPYGVLTAINLNDGSTTFKVPFGETPDAVRTALEKLNITLPEKTGQATTMGLLVTKTLVVVGEGQLTSPPGRQRGAMLRAFDKKTGKEVGAVLMPAQQQGSPMTYAVAGRQYIVVAVGGGTSAGEYVAYALPQQR